MGMAIMIERAKATAGGAGRRDFSRLLYWNSLDFSYRDSESQCVTAIGSFSLSLQVLAELQL